MVFTSLA